MRAIEDQAASGEERAAKRACGYCRENLYRTFTRAISAFFGGNSRIGPLPASFRRAERYSG